MRHPSREFSDSLEFLRLAQLALDGAQLGYVFCHDFERFGLIRGGHAPCVDSHSHDAAV
jgi:hypothetical protein